MKGPAAAERSRGSSVCMRGMGKALALEAAWPADAQEIRALGGYDAAARRLSMRSSRRPRRHWHDFETVVGEMRAYLGSHPRPAGAPVVPTHQCAPRRPPDRRRCLSPGSNGLKTLAPVVWPALLSLPWACSSHP